LKKGASAMDKFTQLYIGTTEWVKKQIS
jgi:hypothetical protein